MGLGKSLVEIERMSRDEFLGWQAYYQLEPWGCHPADQRAEAQLQLLFAINAKKGTTIPRFIERDPRSSSAANPTPEELDEKVRDFFLGVRTVKAEPESKPRKVRRRAALDK